MDLSPLFSKGGTAAYGIDTAGATCTAYEQFLSGAVTLGDFLTSFNSELPIIPVCYRSGMSLYSRAINTPVLSTESDVFYNISEWTVS